MRIGSLFTGYGGLDRAVASVMGATPVWVSDVDPGACKILAHRYPGVPNLGDVTAIDWTQVEPVDVVTGGFPCQDVSHAGKRAGLKPGTRSGLWTHMVYAVSQLRPRYVIAENVRGLLSARADSDVEPCPWCVGGAADGEPDLRALGAVLGDLAGIGYDARWCGLRAADVGAPHGRFRVFIVATDTQSKQGRVGDGDDVRVGRGEVGSGQDAGRGATTDSERGGRERGAGELWPRRRTEPADSSGAAPDSDASGREGREPARRRHLPDRGAAPDTTSDGRHEGRAEPTRLVGGPDVAERGDQTGTDWGLVEPAIRRWETILGRPVPTPTEPAPKGGRRLAPRFTEFMMGLPEGWVTNVPGLTWAAQLTALGNGVVPQQTEAALHYLLADDGQKTRTPGGTHHE